MGLDDKIIFAGNIDDPSRILGAFDIFAISSDTEQMPLSIIEAMAAGLPIAGVDVGDIKEMVSDENRRFIVARQTEELAGAILNLLSDSETRLHIGAANRKHAWSNYTLNRMVHSYQQLLSMSQERI